MAITFSDIEHPRTAKVFGERQLLSLNNFARAIGVDPVTAWRWKTSGARGYKLPTERIGSRIVVVRAGFDAWHKKVNDDSALAD